MTAREPSAVEVIAEALPHRDWCNTRPVAGVPCVCHYLRVATAENVCAAIRAMTPEQQAELIGGEVRRLTTLKPHSDTHPFCIPRTCPHREYGQHQERVVGPWREVQP